MAEVRTENGRARAGQPSSAIPLAREAGLAGVAGGLLGGVLMVLWLVVYGAGIGLGPGLAAQLIASTVLGVEALIGGPGALLLGLALHLTMAALFGILYALVIDREATVGVALLGAVVYAIGLYLVMTYLVLPLVDPVLAERVKLMQSAWFLAHLLFALGLGITPAVRRKLAGPGVLRDRADR